MKFSPKFVMITTVHHLRVLFFTVLLALIGWAESVPAAFAQAEHRTGPAVDLTPHEAISEGRQHSFSLRGASSATSPGARLACGGGGNRPYHFGGTLQVRYDQNDDGTAETIPLEGVQLRIVRANSPLKWAQGPDAVTDSNGEYEVRCTFARDRNGVAPGGKKIRFKVMARFRDDEFRMRKAGWTRNNWFEIGRRQGCNRSGGAFTSECVDNEFRSVDKTFDTDDTAGKHAYMWWFYNDLESRMEREDIGLTNRPFFKRNMTVTYPEKSAIKSGSSFLFNTHLASGDWNNNRTMIHEYMHRWDIGKLGGEGHLSCLLDAHHKSPDRWASSRCSGFMEGFAEAAAVGLKAEWYGGDIKPYSHSDLQQGNLNKVDPDANYPITTRGEAERTDIGWENFIELIMVDNEEDYVSGSMSCEPTDVGVIRMLQVLQQDASRKANWYEVRPNATFEWFTGVLEEHVSGFTTEDARIYQKLGDPSLTGSEVCEPGAVAEKHDVVISSRGIPGATSYRLEGGGSLLQVDGELSGMSVTRQVSDRVSGNRANGQVSNGRDGYLVDGDIPTIKLDNPGNAKVFVDGEPYHTVVIKSDDVSGATGYTVEGGGKLIQMTGTLSGIQVTKQGNDTVSGSRAQGRVGGGNDGFAVLGDVPSVNLDNPSNAEVYIDGEKQ